MYRLREENRSQRREAIEQAAYELLAEKGYLGTSILAIARRAKASNETLYRWYGDKQGLFRSLVESNAEAVRASLHEALSKKAPGLDTLATVGPLLLELLVSERAITLNRAAAADSSGELAQALAEAGRGTIAPMLADVMLRARRDGELAFDDASAAAGLYVDLLVGDLQIRRVIGAVAPLSRKQVNQRASLALDRLRLLLA